MAETLNATTTPITSEHLEKAISYAQYRDLIDNLLAAGKTTGTDHSDAMVEYTRMNTHRMRRVEKVTVLDDELVQLLLSVQTKMIWVVLTEAWCGDAAQSLPAIVKMADASPLIDVKLLLRDENPELMDQFLTNGGRSIPKLIALDAETLKVLGTWGPRPEPAQQLFTELKAQNVPYTEFVEKLHGWYAKNKSRSLQQEFKPLIAEWSELRSPADVAVERCS
ncbi:thioredoxin-like protein [Pontibacter ummariensis]|uniref:Thioredoxin n=1 Tax=Pontibacter ummariensis TaxID=1610492 RepID=A0A239E2U7_9BACT|nr:thioredoxin family protein [Pontibacter ummariensis]PRY13652.1 thioredoxin-like protein [Pontibacter ummariensis]SNS38292.1 Thioredoxin [Pontibacter ummariensis]